MEGRTIAGRILKEKIQGKTWCFYFSFHSFFFQVKSSLLDGEVRAMLSFLFVAGLDRTAPVLSEKDWNVHSNRNALLCVTSPQESWEHWRSTVFRKVAVAWYVPFIGSIQGGCVSVCVWVRDMRRLWGKASQWVQVRVSRTVLPQCDLRNVSEVTSTHCTVLSLQRWHVFSSLPSLYRSSFEWIFNLHHV